MPRKHHQHLRFVVRAYRMRMLGLVLMALPIGAVLRAQGAPIWLWSLLALNVLLWPQWAYWRAQRHGNPLAAERQNLLVETLMGGLWIGIMHFNPMPSALLLSMLTMGRISAGGARLLGLSLPLLILGAALAWLFGDRALDLRSTPPQMLACLPMLLIYPACMSLLSHTLSCRIRQQNRALDQLSRTDMLTGLSNRSHWLDAAETELLRWRQDGRPAALLLIDLDHFKQVNDCQGHAAGDALLIALAQLLRDLLRDTDTLGRFGGDEFGVVLPDTRYEQALQIAEKMCQRVEKHLRAERGHCTLSIGVASIGKDTTDVQQWLKRADMALYRAKSAGRNRVCGEHEGMQPA